ncbi:uncharacterized protein N7483_000618 [Penicillium malachiteum]|uniref:uncharacterized protein n=1 Tax=Penicillium malachiteum TaxID=1324776 RepID=UPI002547AFA8|nr:uncharacterized protein N7483_000618 [Penicillium malachiteum]KAJ5735493.1 hypothetical protein N7483_000618 [Penicillium malachiteum]
MPGVEVMRPSVDSPERSLLRSHKSLQQSGIVTSIDVAQPVSPERNGTLPAPALPLTPPGAIHDDSMEDEITPRKADSRSETQTAILTPRRLSKPPTPDVTPPRTSSNKRPLLNNLVHLSSSSRAESFQTALESISSDGDMDTPGRVPLNVSQRGRPRVPSSHQDTPSGYRMKLGYAKDTPPSASQPHSETGYETGFESFDGEWATNQIEGFRTPFTGKQKRPMIPDQRNVSPSFGNGTLDVLSLDASLTREKNLRDRVRKTPDFTETPSMERFREEIGWPSYEASAAGDPESRRLSGLSTTSTVEAMIIDSPKRSQRLLRHSEKRSSLRSASSPVTKSERTSTPSNPDSQHRLVHKAARISEYDRRSISSDVSFSTRTVASAPRTSVDIIPVVVVPERKSSLKAGTGSHNSQISSNRGSQKSSRGPPVSSENSSQVNVPRQRRRNTSESASAQPQDRDSRGRNFGRPIIPPRSSSLSAATSRNHSRATSLTSESLRSHTLAMDLEMQKRREHQPVSPPRHNILASNANASKKEGDQVDRPRLPTFLLNSAEDVSTLRPPSMPCTQWSIPSSSPGPIEIREATAVSMFAHNNRSLLLVEQRLPGPEVHTLQAFHQIRKQISNPHTPDNPIDPATLNVDSPLKNPRPPPKPPVSKPLPPVPIPPKHNTVGFGGGLSRHGSTRRTFTARPRSNSFNNLVRSLSIKSAKNRKAGMEVDSRLHPMWRPRGFWEDISGSPKKGNTARQSLQSPNDMQVVNNSLGLPQSRLIIEGPPALARRSPEMRRLFNGMPSAAHYNASNGSLVDRGMFRSGSPLYQPRYHALSRWGVRLRSFNLRNVRTRLRRMRQRRDERKRTTRRDNLKQSIGGPVHVVSSATHGITR